MKLGKVIIFRSEYRISIGDIWFSIGDWKNRFKYNRRIPNAELLDGFGRISDTELTHFCTDINAIPLHQNCSVRIIDTEETRCNNKEKLTKLLLHHRDT
jgi:hypothetical protein